jgi:hypothetical protein
VVGNGLRFSATIAVFRLSESGVEGIFATEAASACFETFSEFFSAMLFIPVFPVEAVAFANGVTEAGDFKSLEVSRALVVS